MPRIPPALLVKPRLTMSTSRALLPPIHHATRNLQHQHREGRQMATPAKFYQSYSPADKEALKELRAHMKERTGLADVSLADAISAVEPELPTPEHLKGC